MNRSIDGFGELTQSYRGDRTLVWVFVCLGVFVLPFGVVKLSIEIGNVEWIAVFMGAIASFTLIMVGICNSYIRLDAYEFGFSFCDWSGEKENWRFDSLESVRRVEYLQTGEIVIVLKFKTGMKRKLKGLQSKDAEEVLSHLCEMVDQAGEAGR